MIFSTESGSNYEIDTNKKRIRRLSGTIDPTSRQGSDGEWKDYTTISPPAIGEPVLIVWRFEQTDGGRIAKSTLTSRLVNLEIEN